MALPRRFLVILFVLWASCWTVVAVEQDTSAHFDVGQFLNPKNWLEEPVKTEPSHVHSAPIIISKAPSLLEEPTKHEATHTQSAPVAAVAPLAKAPSLLAKASSPPSKVPALLEEPVTNAATKAVPVPLAKASSPTVIAAIPAIPVSVAVEPRFQELKEEHTIAEPHPVDEVAPFRFSQTATQVQSGATLEGEIAAVRSEMAREITRVRRRVSIARRNARRKERIMQRRMRQRIARARARLRREERKLAKCRAGKGGSSCGGGGGGGPIHVINNINVKAPMSGIAPTPPNPEAKVKKLPTSVPQKPKPQEKPKNKPQKPKPNRKPKPNGKPKPKKKPQKPKPNRKPKPQQKPKPRPRPSRPPPPSRPLPKRSKEVVKRLQKAVAAAKAIERKALKAEVAITKAKTPKQAEQLVRIAQELEKDVNTKLKEVEEAKQELLITVEKAKAQETFIPPHIWTKDEAEQYEKSRFVSVDSSGNAIIPTPPVTESVARNAPRRGPNGPLGRLCAGCKTITPQLVSSTSNAVSFTTPTFRTSSALCCQTAACPSACPRLNVVPNTIVTVTKAPAPAGQVVPNTWVSPIEDVPTSASPAPVVSLLEKASEKTDEQVNLGGSSATGEGPFVPGTVINVDNKLLIVPKIVRIQSQVVPVQTTVISCCGQVSCTLTCPAVKTVISPATFVTCCGQSTCTDPCNHVTPTIVKKGGAGQISIKVIEDLPTTYVSDDEVRRLEAEKKELQEHLKASEATLQAVNEAAKDALPASVKIQRDLNAINSGKPFGQKIDELKRKGAKLLDKQKMAEAAAEQQTKQDAFDYSPMKERKLADSIYINPATATAATGAVASSFPVENADDEKMNKLISRLGALMTREAQSSGDSAKETLLELELLTARLKKAQDAKETLERAEGKKVAPGMQKEDDLLAELELRLGEYRQKMSSMVDVERRNSIKKFKSLVKTIKILHAQNRVVIPPIPSSIPIRSPSNPQSTARARRSRNERTSDDGARADLIMFIKAQGKINKRFTNSLKSIEKTLKILAQQSRPKPFEKPQPKAAPATPKLPSVPQFMEEFKSLPGEDDQELVEVNVPAIPLMKPEHIRQMPLLRL